MPLEKKPAALDHLLARLSQRNQLTGAEAHLAGDAVEHVPKQPRARAALGDLEIEVAADPPRPRILERLHLEHRQGLHARLTSKPTHKRSVACTGRCRDLLPLRSLA
jgi:predicted Zn-dependent protease with MMP-like domain